MANVLSLAKQITVLSCLIDGCSGRATARISGVNRKTVLSLLVRIGEGCVGLHDEYMQDLQCDDIQCDEIWAYCYCKQRQVHNDDENHGDQYTFYALDRETKLIPSFLVGKRSWANTVNFMYDLGERLDFRIRPQITTDGFKPYRDAVERVFGTNVDYAQIVKDYGTIDAGRGRYSPPKVMATEVTVMQGEPDEDRITTSHVERANLTMRMNMRRLTRLTNAFSKKLRNLRAAIALYFAHYNFCRIHQTLRTTPAMAAGITTEVWSLERLIEEATFSAEVAQAA